MTQVLWILCLAMVLSGSQSLKVVWQILLPFLFAGIRKSSGGMAGMWPSNDLLESDESLLLLALLQWWQVELLKHVCHTSWLSRPVLL